MNKEHSSLFQTLRADLEAQNISATNPLAVLANLFLRPEYLAVFLHRLAYAGTHMGIIGKISARLWWRTNILLTGCTIAPQTMIGPGLNLPHPIGIVIGTKVIIGHHATIYQNVTIGLRHSPLLRDLDLYPTIGNNVTIYSGAVIVGGIKIGDGAIIGANAVVTKDIPENCIAVGVPARISPIQSTRS